MSNTYELRFINLKNDDSPFPCREYEEIFRLNIENPHGKNAQDALSMYCNRLYWWLNDATAQRVKLENIPHEFLIKLCNAGNAMEYKTTMIATGDVCTDADYLILIFVDKTAMPTIALVEKPSNCVNLKDLKSKNLAEFIYVTGKDGWPEFFGNFKAFEKKYAI